MRKHLSVIIILLGFLIPGTAQLKLGILGSSTAAGTGASPASNSWVNLLSAKYISEGAVSSTINLAVGGYNPYHAMPSDYTPPADRPDPDLDNNITYLMTDSPDIVIVSFVSNQYNIYSFAEIFTTLSTIRDSAIEAGAVCFITTPQPRTSFNAAGRQKLRDLTDSVLLWFGDYAINFFDPLVDSSDLSIHPDYRYSGDQIHINNLGHEILFNQVVEKNIIGITLPVKLEGFSVLLKNNLPEITWKVSDEETETKYEIQRSENGKDFSMLHTVQGSGEAGIRSYHFVDREPFNRSNYYRLKIIENDRIFYSDIQVLTFNEKHKLVVDVYPNPARDIINLRVATEKDLPANLIITDMNGRNILTRKIVLSGSGAAVSVPVQHLIPGNYLIRIEVGGEVINGKFLKR